MSDRLFAIVDRKIIKTSIFGHFGRLLFENLPQVNQLRSSRLGLYLLEDR